MRFDTTEVIDALPDTLVVVARMLGRGRVSGVEVQANGASVWTLRDGVVTALTLHQTRDEALEAVGLAPSAVPQALLRKGRPCPAIPDHAWSGEHVARESQGRCTASKPTLP